MRPIVSGSAAAAGSGQMTPAKPASSHAATSLARMADRASADGPGGVICATESTRATIAMTSSRVNGRSGTSAEPHAPKETAESAFAGSSPGSSWPGRTGRVRE